MKGLDPIFSCFEKPSYRTRFGEFYCLIVPSLTIEPDTPTNGIDHANPLKTKLKTASRRFNTPGLGAALLIGILIGILIGVLIGVVIGVGPRISYC